MTDKSNYHADDDRYEAQNDISVNVTGDINDSSYVRPGLTAVPTSVLKNARLVRTKAYQSVVECVIPL